MRFQKAFLFIFAIVYCDIALASLVVPNDGPYYRLRRDQVLYVYDGPSSDIIGQIEAFMRTPGARQLRGEALNWHLDEEQDLLLTSSHHRSPTPTPRSRPISRVCGTRGSGLLESIAESSWFLTLATHETSHLYQLNSTAPLPAALKKVFGNTAELIPFVWPISLHPNLYTPTFLLEGNAVLNESRANMGGRLYSGEVRALVLAQIEAGEIDPVRLINDEYRFPYGLNAYYQGGYFAAHLATKYGVDKANQFFLAQGEHYLNPLILNKTFRAHFGASYAQEIHEYVREWQGLAKTQRVLTGPTLVESAFVGPLNHDGGKVFFLATNGTQLGELYTFAKADGTQSQRDIDLPMGKVFEVDGKNESVASEAHDLHHIEYSLYGEEHAFDENFRSQIVNDRRAGKTVALDAANAWLEPRLLVNGEFYDVAHSSPILDEQGNVFYFRQNGSERILYKNREPLFKFAGFYGKLTEVDADGTVYFIGCTDRGATLYAFKNNEIVRVLNSDRVVDARLLKDGKFLAVEVGPCGLPRLAGPSRAAGRAPSPLLLWLCLLSPDSAARRGPEQTRADQRPYNGLGQLRYSSLDLVSDYSSVQGLGLYADAHWADPLEYHSIDAGFSGSQLVNQQYFAQYTYTRFLPQIFANYSYRHNEWWQYNGLRRSAYDQLSELGAQLPFLRWRHWDASASTSLDYYHSDQRLDPSAPGATVAGAERGRHLWRLVDVEFSLQRIARSRGGLLSLPRLCFQRAKPPAESARGVAQEIQHLVGAERGAAGIRRSILRHRRR